jgi:serine acetyltransferase
VKGLYSGFLLYMFTSSTRRREFSALMVQDHLQAVLHRIKFAFNRLFHLILYSTFHLFAVHRLDNFIFNQCTNVVLEVNVHAAKLYVTS